MSDSASPSWPDDEDPFSSIDENSSEENDVEPSNHQEDETNEESGESIEEIEETVTSNENMEVAQWSLPIRAAPIMALGGDEVQEFPLVETPDGLTSTSLVINEKLIRIVESNYGNDGQRRLNIKSAMKHELTGFSHNHNELMHKHQWLWISAFIGGLLISILIPMVSLLGQLLVGIGLIGWVYMHLEVHSLEFSANGSKHKITLTGYGSNRPRFRLSMALIGPTLAKYMEIGEFDTESINDLHEALSKPQQIISPNSQIQSSQQQFNQFPAPNPPEVMNQSQPPELNSLPTPPAISDSINSANGVNNLPPPPPPQEVEQNDSSDNMKVIDHAPMPPAPLGEPAPPAAGPPTSAPANTHAPPPPTSLPTPAPPTTNPGPPIPPPPTKSSLPPATLPPPLPPPIGLGLGPIDAGEVPLNAPLPDAPEIAVKASPVEESLTEDEQNELLEELK